MSLVMKNWRDYLFYTILGLQLFLLGVISTIGILAIIDTAEQSMEDQTMKFVIRIFDDEYMDENQAIDEFYFNTNTKKPLEENEINIDTVLCECRCDETRVLRMYCNMIDHYDGHVHMVRDLTNNELIVGGILEPGDVDVLRDYLIDKGIDVSSFYNKN